MMAAARSVSSRLLGAGVSRRVLPAAVIVLTLFLAHFQLAAGFGFYEDDYAFITRGLGWDASSVVDYLRQCFTEWPQGRPLGFFLPRAMSAGVSALDGGLWWYYAAAFGVHLINAYLFLRLLRLLGTELFALCGALAFVLWPADTTRPLLMHAYGLHTSLTFALIAAILYLRGHKSVSYLALLLSLLIYESPVPVFLCVPLLRRDWDRGLAKELIVHALIVVGMVLGAVLLRGWLGETRMASTLAEPSAVFRAPIAMVLGPIVSLALLAVAPLWAVLHLDAGIALSVAVGFLAMYVAAQGLGIPQALTAAEGIWSPDRLSLDRRPSSRWGNPSLRLVLAGALMLAASYATAFTPDHFPPRAWHGRLTSVHLSSCLGGSLIIAVVAVSGLRKAVARKRLRLGVALGCLFLSGLVGYGVLVQEDFRLSWSEQRSFWSRVLALCPDMAEGTMVFVVQPQSAEKTYYIHTYSWADPIILEQLYHYPEGWRTPPRLWVVGDGWTEELFWRDGALEWMAPAADWPPHWENLPAGNTILLRSVDGILIRETEELEVANRAFPLKAGGAPVISQLPQAPLHRYLIGGD